MRQQAAMGTPRFRAYVRREASYPYILSSLSLQLCNKVLSFRGFSSCFESHISSVTGLQRKFVNLLNVELIVVIQYASERRKLKLD